MRSLMVILCSVGLIQLSLQSSKHFEKGVLLGSVIASKNHHTNSIPFPVHQQHHSQQHHSGKKIEFVPVYEYHSHHWNPIHHELIAGHQEVW